MVTNLLLFVLVERNAKIAKWRNLLWLRKRSYSFGWSVFFYTIFLSNWWAKKLRCVGYDIKTMNLLFYIVTDLTSTVRQNDSAAVPSNFTETRFRSSRNCLAGTIFLVINEKNIVTEPLARFLNRIIWIKYSHVIYTPMFPTNKTANSRMK
jgi:hypothetical protein